jgi:hypothetical protein
MVGSTCSGMRLKNTAQYPDQERAIAWIGESEIESISTDAAII